MKKWFALILLLPTIGFGKQSLKTVSHSNQRSNDQPSVFSNYSFGLAYRVTTDLMEQTSPPTYNNVISLSASVKFRNWFDLLGGLNFNYVALGNAIPNEPDNPGLGDFYLGLSRDYILSSTFSLLTKVMNTFPTSEKSRIEGYQSVLDLSSALKAKVYKDIYSVTNFLSLGHIFNINEFSPSTRQYNAEWLARYVLTNSVLIAKGLTFSFSLFATATTFTDGASTLASGNITSLSYDYKKWTASLAYTNGPDLPQGQIDLWLINQYQKMVTFRLAYAF
ncbi:MAG: hypothetical protein A4S09_05135 [Proteobacteria bacterium SG_bin7]|nr:MAG: hypothetical protein A4S09_05135 [Proteobacteria bacterium SG_bin7]